MVLIGCESGPIETLIFKSPNGDKEVTVSGTQNSALDPIMVTIHAKVPKGDDKGLLEFQSGSLTAKNCTMEWKELSCLILISNF